MSILKIPTAKIFEPLLKPARYKGVYGGRGSGKSHFFGELLVETCQAERGTLAVCIREAQRTLAQSSKRLIEGKIASLRLGHGFKLFSDKIETPGDGLIIFRGLQDHTADSIKSLEGFRIAWIDEAQSLSARSLALLRPTIRAKDSELWASWNPRRKSDAIDDFLRGRKPDGSVVVKANWRDNPWFPDVLGEERLLDQKLYPERYDHIWEGEYARAFEGAYFASLLSEARAQGRIGKVAADPLLPLRAFIDIGGAGAAADAFTMWIVQWVGSDRRDRALVRAGQADGLLRSALLRKALGLGQGPWVWLDGRAGGICGDHGQSGRLLLLRQARFRERCEDHQAVKIQDDEIRAIVAQTLAEQQRVQQESVDAIVLKAVTSVLASFGIEDDDRKELRADFQHLRRWRKSVEQAQSYTFKAVITVIATGLMGAVWLGVKVVLGK